MIRSVGGGNGNIGTAIAAKASADGYVLVFASGTTFRGHQDGLIHSARKNGQLRLTALVREPNTSPRDSGCVKTRRMNVWQDHFVASWIKPFSELVPPASCRFALRSSKGR